MIYEKYIQLVSFTIIGSFAFAATLYFRASALPPSCRDGGFGSSGDYLECLKYAVSLVCCYVLILCDSPRPLSTGVCARA